MSQYQIIEATADSKVGFSPRGGARQLWKSKEHEVILGGPAETGKTYSALQKLDTLMWKYPGAQSVIARKTYKSCVGSVCQTFERKVANMKAIETLGGTRPERYIYPNGSTIWIGGMDNPDKVLSSERDFIYVNQAEELELSDWETLATRCTGRAGNSPYSQLMGDCNPGPPHHWIKQRAAAGNLELFASKHEDNPVLYDDSGSITEQGQRTIKVLSSLTGLRYKRLYLGLWVQAEGVIYETFDEGVHVIPRFDIPPDWTRIRVIDFGYVHPFVCGWWAIDNDGSMYLYRQIYMTRRTVKVHAEQINELSASENIEATICDHDAEDRATLEENGIYAQPADKAVSVGIEKVQERLKVQENGKPRIYFLRDSLVEVDPFLEEAHKPISTEQEFGGYIWNDRVRREEPVKIEDDGMDMTRYGAMYVDGGGQSLQVGSSPLSGYRG